jgi:ADP-ribose pyrophosphatase YjhB (NUDIX family)
MIPDRPPRPYDQAALPLSEVMSWRNTLEPFARPMFFFWSRLTRAKTLGVRVLVQDEQGRVLLVRHTYLDGWYLPGGGVDARETLESAAIRELAEETGLVAQSRPVLISVHANERFMPGDHVAVMRVDSFDPGVLTSRHEIAEVGFFALDALPDDLNRGTRARLAEIFDGAEVSPDW